MDKKIIGRCPLCGGNVVKTCKGYRCENNIAEQPTCVLNINGIIGNRKMSDEEIAELLEHRFILLDGFASKEGKAFPSVLELADNGAINMQSVIGKCPHCGGDVENAIIYADEENKEYFVYCPICGIETVETYASKAKALKAFADGKTKPISGKEAGGGE